MKYTKYDHAEIEPAILNFWKYNGILEKIRKRNSKNEKYYFLQGPPYTSGRIHLGHAWNMSLKDMLLRYKRMRGLHVWDRAGYDMHGLPTEHATEKKLGIKGKEQIETFGVDKFVRECEVLCKQNLQLMNRDFIRLGATLDFENAYQSVTDDFIDGEWWLIKRAHEQGRLYEGLRTMHWDTASSTGVAKHELEYKSVTDKSVYLKLQLKENKKTFLVVWTTTPWTLPFNLAAMVHPGLTYVKCSVGDEVLILARSRAEYVIKKMLGRDYKVIQELKGKQLEGLKYIHPFEKEIPFFTEIKTNKKLHTILISEEYVDDVSGTGIVHTAPGCGPEDYEVGHKNHLPPFNTVDEKGIAHNLGPFTGLKARTEDAQFTALFEEKGVVVAKESYTHDYPHDWRSHEPVIFRATKQWFFKVEDMKEHLIAANNKVKWHPEAGYNAFNSWLENLRDNSITKQRYWGTPLPIWRNVDKENDYIVVGSIKELEKLSGKKVKSPHKPWIDELVIKKDGKLYKRVPDVIDVWVDAGTTSWNCLYYPSKKQAFDEFFPADFILEGKDQIRGWFNLLMVASFLALNKPSFKAVYMHGFVTDVEGVKMSKSLGNVISPDEVVNRYGADVLRYYSIQTRAGEDMNFSWESLELKHRQLNVLWNIQNFLMSLTREIKTNPFELDSQLMPNLFDMPEKVIFSRLHRTIRDVTFAIENYHLDEAVEPLETMFLELSRTYIQLVREKSSIGSKEEKELVVYATAHVLLGILKIFAPVVPFITEAIFQNLREEYKLKQESIHEFDWPSYDENRIDVALEEEMSIAQDIVSASLRVREQIKLSARWPLKELVIVSSDQKVISAVERLRELIENQVNVKELVLAPQLAAVKEMVKVNYEKISPRYKALTPKIIAKLAIDSKETLLSHIEREGAYAFTIDGTEVRIVKEDLLMEREVPWPYKAAEFSKGVIYVNQQRTEKLEAEGYSREIMRRVQSLRKTAGLEKPDRISLYLKTSQELKSMLGPFSEDIKNKVGAKKIVVDILDPVKKHQVVSEEKIKGEEFLIYFDKV